MYRWRSMNGSTFRLIIPKLAIEFAIMTAVAVILAVLGPFGTWNASFESRLINWAIFVFGGYACFRPVIAGGTALAAQSALPRWAAIAVACTLAAMPTTLIVAKTFAGDNWRALTAGDLAGLYLEVLIVGATVTVVQLLADRTPRQEAHETLAVHPSMPAAASSLLDRAGPLTGLLDALPPHLGTDILCLENEDHYVRVYTTAGNALILMRLRDAIAQLAGVEGAQVHRSWWVARSAVKHVVRSERQLLLKLTDGREVPVSRSAVSPLREKGWL